MLRPDGTDMKGGHTNTDSEIRTPGVPGTTGGRRTWRAALADLVLGREANQRLRVTRSLTAMFVFIVCILVAEYAVAHRLSSAFAAHALQAGMILWMAMVYATLRSGLNLRFADPALTLPQIIGACIWITVAYVVFAPVRGALLMLLALALVFGIFNLNARGRRICNGFAVGSLGIAMIVMSHLRPADFPPHVEIIHFLLVATILPVESMLGAQLGNIRLRLRNQRNELEHALGCIREMATRDELTGLHNRRYMLDMFGHLISRLERSATRFSLCLIDLDHFKRINDTHGHGVGDEVLRRFADIADASLRESDMLARWGGEEFLVLLPDTGAEQACISAQRIRAALGDHITLHDHRELKVTFSAGVTEFRRGETVEQAIERADRALYHAKSEGRDRTALG
jgi:diguanylate cyclase (GGDEF)-like protein